MNRIQEKIKDVVDVHLYHSLKDFSADPAQTLASYYFTDVTADLMAKWLDRIATVHTRSGTAFALAGYRGVGKSHFLGVFGALMSHPELRSRVKDGHVSASAQRLIRRHYPVAYVRRGTKETLLEELKDAVSRSLEIQSADLSDSLAEILKAASEKGGAVPFVLIIDTAFERDSRVSRDDGVLLGEIAEAAKNLNIFLGIALDDDIAGADGINSAIARSFTIEFLDQEHLYKILDAHIFPKNNQMRPLLQDLYEEFRKLLPGFRWSEQRFASLYPLHPAVLEVAPFVRLYVHDFALLEFASEAGGRVTSRPANSLIALDELFDSVEKRLRSIKELNEAFVAYDKLNDDVVAKIPVMQRLQAKLILKALLLLSLDGEGASAGDICAAMLIFDETDPEKAAQTVEDLMSKFIAVLPDDIRRHDQEGRDIRYGFKLAGKDDLNSALTDEIDTVPADVVTRILRRLMRDRFSDCTFPDEIDAAGTDWMECQIAWRGGLRRGRLHWTTEDQTHSTDPTTSDLVDWEVVIDFGNAKEKRGEAGDNPVVFWKPDELRQDEIDTVRRYYLLLSNTGLREEFNEQIGASVHSHTIAVERLWSRKFLQYGKLIIDGVEHEFTEEARSTQTLSDLFSLMLAPVFESRFPKHPHFAQTLGMTEVSTLVTELFSGLGQNLDEVQHLAQVFALPLGLVSRRGDMYVPESEEALAALPIASDVLRLVNEAGESGVSLKTIYAELKKPPHGLVREAQHLILTALVSRRYIEFVTSKGDRINRRSLDLRIIWNDIVGVVKPTETVYSGEKSTKWAKILTGVENFSASGGKDETAAIRAALEDWLESWKTRRVLDRFNELPDEILNTKIWRLTMHAENSFGVAADTITSVMENSMSLDEALHRIADSFSDSEQEFETRTKELEIIEDFIDGASMREDVRSYLSVCEVTRDNNIERFRDELLGVIDRSYSNQGDVRRTEIESSWLNFQKLFSDFFTASHDAVMKSHYLQEKYDEILSSDQWWEFENLSNIAAFRGVFWRKSQMICREFKELDCQYDTKETLKVHPFCGCSFSLAKMEYWEKLPQILSQTIIHGLDSYKVNLIDMSDEIVPKLKAFADNIGDNEFAAAARNLIRRLKEGEEISRISNDEMKVLQKIFELLPEARQSARRTASAAEFMSDAEINNLMEGWIADATDDTVTAKV